MGKNDIDCHNNYNVAANYYGAGDEEVGYSQQVQGQQQHKREELVFPDEKLEIDELALLVIPYEHFALELLV